MKTLLFPALPLCVWLVTGAHGFTLDAAGYEGGEFVGNPCSILVPGYGEVVLETSLGKPLVVDPAYCSNGNSGYFPSAGVAHDPVRIEFADPAGHEEPVAEDDTEGGNSDTVWSSIPEPTSAGLGLIGVLLLLFGRWR